MTSACLCTDLQQIVRYAFNGPLPLVENFYTFVLLLCVQISPYLSPRTRHLYCNESTSPRGYHVTAAVIRLAELSFVYTFLLTSFTMFFFPQTGSQFVCIFTLITNSFSLFKLTATFTFKFIHPFFVLSSSNPSFQLL